MVGSAHIILKPVAEVWNAKNHNFAVHLKGGAGSFQGIGRRNPSKRFRDPGNRCRNRDLDTQASKGLGLGLEKDPRVRLALPWVGGGKPENVHAGGFIRYKGSIRRNLD
jgi:hypothetical protein